MTHHTGGIPMIGHCFNPDCNEELRYLRQGSVYERENRGAADRHSEFFWLCPVCSISFRIVSGEDSVPLLDRRLSSETHPASAGLRQVFSEMLEGFQEKVSERFDSSNMSGG